jgi:hypothetical protein
MATHSTTRAAATHVSSHRTASRTLTTARGRLTAGWSGSCVGGRLDRVERMGRTLLLGYTAGIRNLVLLERVEYAASELAIINQIDE